MWLGVSVLVSAAVSFLANVALDRLPRRVATTQLYLVGADGRRQGEVSASDPQRLLAFNAGDRGPERSSSTTLFLHLPAPAARLWLHTPTVAARVRTAPPYSSERAAPGATPPLPVTDQSEEK
ncbi:MAG TPA: hypothetical protein DCZ72_11640 [Armatimonadetes bacterium]|mgnify:FL=1|nr:hypothetical protein [Armatimonadota bacterium]